MKKRTKQLTIRTSFVVALVMSIVWLIYSLNAARIEGQVYARGKNIKHCVTEVTFGNHICTQWTCFFDNFFFYKGCLSAAQYNPYFCKSMPSIYRLADMEFWRREQCERLGRDDRICRHIWSEALYSCEEG